MARLAIRAPLLLSRNFWIWPIFGAVLISVVGLWTRNLVEAAMKAELANHLQTLLNADVAALRLWLSEKEADAKSFAADSRVQEAIISLCGLTDVPGMDRAGLLSSEPAKTLALYIKPLLPVQKYQDYIVVATNRTILISGEAALIGHPVPVEYEPFVRRALGGQATVSRPFYWQRPATNQVEGPTMFSASPIRDGEGRVVAILALRMNPQEDFSRILGVARLGETGDAYAFDSRGFMLTASRFDDDLKRLGLIPNNPDATTILKLQLLDPGVELRTGGQPAKSRANLPLTRMAAAATTEWSGYDVEGYRNYRGSKVVGAWAWLPDYGLGVAAELETREAYQTLNILRRAFFALFLLLVLSGLVTFAFSVLVERLQSSLRRNALASRKIGQYVLLQEIGRGASGMVYRARHAILRRPVAVKLLSPEMTNEANAVRFEHEVQMTSQLTHPNTVAIYDYGRTPEGLFYYAMEYLSGINLDRLVRQFGPQPEGRVVHILRQVCGSLAEAHRIGLIHRDIKPANIVLTRRAGVCDMVKVLDFGLVKAVALGPEGFSPKAVVGTPHFISPEAVKDPEKVDARSDLYGLGAVAYWLLTGKTLFDDENVDVLLEEQTTRTPGNPSQRRGGPISADLELLVMRCLSKLPQDRVQTAEDLDNALAACAVAGTWSTEQAEAWWRDHLGGTQIIPIPAPGEQ